MTKRNDGTAAASGVTFQLIAPSLLQDSWVLLVDNGDGQWHTAATGPASSQELMVQLVQAFAMVTTSNGPHEATAEQRAKTSRLHLPGK